MKRRFYYINYIIVYISMIILFLTMLSKTYNISIQFNLIYTILLCIYIFILGNKYNNKYTYNKNIKIYIVLYALFLLNITFLNNRSGFDLINKEYLKYYRYMMNIIPFKSIFSFLNGESGLKAALLNIIGNFIMLFPLSILLFLKNIKYNNIKLQAKSLIIISCFIELLQFVFSIGFFDIDDLILNIFGSLIFFVLLKKVIDINKLRNSFYTKLKINNKWFNILYIILLIIIISINSIIMIEYIDNFKTQNINYEYEKIDVNN